jgi:uncharacterized protein (TIGR03435 family)
VLVVALPVTRSRRRRRTEVASIKRNTAGEDDWYVGVNTTQPGAARFTNMSLQDIVCNAYGVDFLMRQSLVTGRPQQILSERFDVDARSA